MADKGKRRAVLVTCLAVILWTMLLAASALAENETRSPGRESAGQGNVDPEQAGGAPRLEKLEAALADTERDVREEEEKEGFLLTRDEEGLSIGLGGNVSESPYKGYGAKWTALPMVSFEHEYVYIRGTTAGVKLLNLSHVEVSAFAGYDGTSFESSDSSDSRLRRLRDRHSSAEAGMEARLLTPVGLIFSNVSRDILGHSDGLRGTLGYANSWEYGPLEVAPSAGLYWTDSKYNNYYYGVSDSESRKSGLDAYDAGGGVSPFLGMTISLELSDNVGVFCSGEMQFLNNAIKESPMVGKSHTHSGTAGIMIGF